MCLNHPGPTYTVDIPIIPVIIGLYIVTFTTVGFLLISYRLIVMEILHCLRSRVCRVLPWAKDYLYTEEELSPPRRIYVKPDVRFVTRKKPSWCKRTPLDYNLLGDTDYEVDEDGMSHGFDMLDYL